MMWTKVLFRITMAKTTRAIFLVANITDFAIFV